MAASDRRLPPSSGVASGAPCGSTGTPCQDGSEGSSSCWLVTSASSCRRATPDSIGGAASPMAVVSRPRVPRTLSRLLDKGFRCRYHYRNT